MKVLLAVDGSEYTKRLLSYIAARTELLGPGHQYTAFTVIEPVPAFATGFLQADLIDSHYQKQADEVLRSIQAFGKQNDWKLEVRHGVGSPGNMIADLATEGHFDLVVMGSHGSSRLSNVVLGSVSNRVIAQTKVPVLLIR